MDFRSSHLWMLHTTLILHIWWHKCKCVNRPWLHSFFWGGVTHLCLFPRIASPLISVDPLAVLLRAASGENQLAQIYEKIVCERENTCGCPSAVSIVNTSSALKTFAFHASSPLPVIYPDLREIPTNSLFVSFKITFKSRCWAPSRLFGMWRRIWKQLRW